ncbi:adenosine deaminase [Treponema phagedenis]|uniref:Adenosine deaminase n=1 Tax=Treponema phagedenis TaxID=162 RepID=A0A0B7GX90_TREPH|nr:adenosine deaminase [Treponema phagedenis]EFW36716.1 Adenosine/AMP deaminase [Treponema phagedenis F0421]NVP24139.1 adenosine deaminase [Treponema phagedenis]QEJ96292.1 adenosine deaminase [Treponema phagedenis]QEJ99300.1 adenosine deaminase [Treponema phagedenis]QEK00069.1 adenosine deaminase [Treponema phagedenis]
MKDLDYYKSQPKADTHTHLNLSMRYKRYKKWSGITIPNFPRKMKGLDEMHEIIAEYTRPRCKTAQDVLDLFIMSIEDAIEDNVVVMETSVDIMFIRHYQEDLDFLLSDLTNLKKKNKKKIDLQFELGIPKTQDRNFIAKWAEPMMQSKVFSNIDLYGPEVSEGIEDFVYLFKLAEKYGLKKKAHVGEFSDAESVQYFVETFNLDEVQHGIGAANDDSVLQFLADRQIRCNVCPASNVMLGAVKSLETHPIKKMMDAGVPIGLGTDDLLFFGKTNSEQLFDMVSCGLLTESDAEKILSVR